VGELGKENLVRYWLSLV